MVAAMSTMKTTTEAEEFVERLLSEETHAQPSDDCKASELSMQLPPWYDDRKFKAGQRFFWDNLFGQVGMLVVGLITIISVPTILHVLAHSRRSSSSHTAYRRYSSTFLHIVSWTKYDLKPGSPSWRSLQEVRTRHVRAGKNARTVGVGTISQRDIALTQFGLMGFVVLCPDKLGIQAFKSDSWEGFVHMWRTLIYMLGLKDEYNLCSGTVEQTTDICQVLLRQVFEPLLEFPPEPLEHMAYVIFDGMWSVLPLVEPRSGMYFTRYVAGVPSYVYTEQELIDFRRKLAKGQIETAVEPVKKGWHEPTPRTFNIQDYELLSDVPEYRKFNFTERGYFHKLRFLAKIYTTGMGRFLLNAFVRLSLFLAEYFPVFAFHRFGFNNSFVNKFDESIADRTKPLSNKEVKELLDRPPWYLKWNPFYSADKRH